MYIQIDGASDNVAKAVTAAMEHLVLKKLCPYVLISSLPVGHTHEDIDSRFGVLWTHMRSKSIYTPDQMRDSIKRAFGNTSNVRVIPVFVICDFKKYYDRFIDEHLVDHYSKGTTTQLVMKIQPLRPTDISESERTGKKIPLVRTNYRKFSHPVSITLSHADPDAPSNHPYIPRVIESRWMPEEAHHASGHKGIGISFLAREPVGFPPFMEFNEWFQKFQQFLNCVKEHFRADPSIHASWLQFVQQMPTSDEVKDYVRGKSIYIPLHQYLYLPDKDFQSYVPQRVLHHREESTEVPLTGTTAFEGSNFMRASSIDFSLLQFL